MNPAEVTIQGMNRHIQPELGVWGWEIALYLFLGGLVAGLLVLSGGAWRREGKPAASLGLFGPLLAPVILSAGMFALFLDLESKLHFFRFYTTFRWTAPMSWGAWILLLVYPAALLFAWAAWQRRRGNDFPFARKIASLNVACGVALGVYTGLLLGALAARPLWNSPVLGPLFLSSGLSSASALLRLLERDRVARRQLASWDERFIAVEAILLALFLLGLATGAQAQRQAVVLLFGGSYTAVFWTAVVFTGMLLPVLLERLEHKGRLQPSPAPQYLVLLGGLGLRFVFLLAGQASGWEVV